MDRTKSAGPRTDITKNHECRGLLAVAFHPIGTFCVFTNRFQPQLVEQPSGHVVGVALGKRPLQPFRQSTGAAGFGANGHFWRQDNGQAKNHGYYFELCLCRGLCMLTEAARKVEVSGSRIPEPGCSAETCYRNPYRKRYTGADRRS